MQLGIEGAVSLAFGFAWNFVFSVNKILWTSSYVLFVGGFSLLLPGCCKMTFSLFFI